ncbi:response regulator transcription factor [Wenzhouxiangella sp. AB-CW3]|uniref:response regulator transcription factor n=1 Tax=Wenzhouxiangella sp. AB-CW3 TaxID=2771012 RepID=UPI00168B4892|nr:response regulator transcription factor [Wenzhouxiangella sp. AB-CW3]QOC23227.1 response regulator transcription factor [Wenzhouxiangella sp. AB-CW3]
MIRVLVAEDQAMVLGALAALLDMEPDLQVTGRAANGLEARRLIESDPPDVVLTDIEMPEMSGLDLAEWVRGRQPDVHVIIVTTFARPGYLRRALEAGVRGYLLKDTPAEDLARAIRNVYRGGREIAPELAAEAWAAESPLTSRERDTLRLAAEGLSSSAIAGKLHLSEGTVRNYLSEAIGKLQASNRVEAARIARQNGWL